MQDNTRAWSRIFLWRLLLREVGRSRPPESKSDTFSPEPLRRGYSETMVTV